MLIAEEVLRDNRWFKIVNLVNKTSTLVAVKCWRYHAIKKSSSPVDGVLKLRKLKGLQGLL